jgi:hypothetical protein
MCSDLATIVTPTGDRSSVRRSYSFGYESVPLGERVSLGGLSPFAESVRVLAQVPGAIGTSCLVFSIPFEGCVPGDIPCYLSICSVPSVGPVIVLVRG